jgi:hypothetical protein
LKLSADLDPGSFLDADRDRTLCAVISLSEASGAENGFDLARNARETLLNLDLPPVQQVIEIPAAAERVVSSGADREAK